MQKQKKVKLWKSAFAKIWDKKANANDGLADMITEKTLGEILKQDEVIKQEDYVGFMDKASILVVIPKKVKMKEFIMGYFDTDGFDRQLKTIKLVMDSIKGEGKNLSNYNINPDAPIKLFSAVGCDKCNMTGYKGRIGIFEAIKTNEAIEKIMPENPSEREIKKVASVQGILSMRQDGIVKIINGITSFEEVQSVVELKEE